MSYLKQEQGCQYFWPPKYSVRDCGKGIVCINPRCKPRPGMPGDLAKEKERGGALPREKREE